MKMKLSELKQDSELIDIRKVNAFTVSRYRQAMRTGAQFPPILIDKKTKTIISGNHRYDAYIKEYDLDHEIDVIEKSYKNRAEILKDFATENIAHGRPLEGFERREIIRRMAKENITAEECSKIFNIPVKKIMEYADMSVIVVGGDKPEERSIKHGLEHMNGQKITKEVYEEHREKDTGMSCFHQASQLRRWIQNNLINKNDKKSMKELKLLMEDLQRFFK